MATSLHASRVWSLERLLVLPWLWLKRSRGWRRRGILLLYTLVAGLAAVLVWREASLLRLPDVGDPFDVKAFESVQVPDKQNAFVYYKQAAPKLVMQGAVMDGNRMWGLASGGWAKLPQAVREWVGSNHDALAVWRRGTDCPDALHTPLRVLTKLEDTSNRKQIDWFRFLALLEGSRCEGAGDLAAAWGWYRANLRCGLHFRIHGDVYDHQLADWGDMILRERLIPWIKNPKTDARLLRQALSDLIEIDASVPPFTEALKVEYVALVNSLSDRDRMIRAQSEAAEFSFADTKWFWRTVWFVKNEPKRSRRVARLIFSNWLAHCDTPPAQRPKEVGNQPNYPMWFLYEADARFPYPARALPPKQVFEWLDTASVWRFLPMKSFFETEDARERKSRGVLIVTVAEALYEREHGAPPQSAKDLVGTYLKSLPADYAEQDSEKGSQADSSPR
jgi:hypothetical protein